MKFNNGSEIIMLDGECDRRGDPYKISDELFDQIASKACHMCGTQRCPGGREDVLRCLEYRDKEDVGVCGQLIFEQTELKIE